MKILAVDDARDMRSVIQHLLKKLGHEVDTAEDGQDAWEKIQKNTYQVVVSDWIMPRMDGLALCRQIRKAEFSGYIYFILLTGMSGKKNLISGIEAGADDFATKPVELGELEVRLRSAQRVLDLEHSLAQKNKSLEAANKTIQKDLLNAAATQLSVLPGPLQHDRLDVAWLFKPAVYIGGDTFNYFFDSTDLFLFFCIDVSGHGASSAMVSMSIQTSLIEARGLYGGPINAERASEIPHMFASNLNQMMLKNKSEHYLTMIFGVVDLDKNRLHYVQAGHPFPYFYNEKEDKLHTLEVTGFPVGLIEQAEYETQELQFEPGDKLILYSDGISENESAINGELLENENLYKHFDEVKARSAGEIIDEISGNWLSQAQMDQLPDDVSVLIFKFN